MKKQINRKLHNKIVRMYIKKIKIINRVASFQNFFKRKAVFQEKEMNAHYALRRN